MVIAGLIFILSAYQPTAVAIIPMKKTYIMYRMVVASELNVHLALAKNEKVTATQKAAKFENDCCEPAVYREVNTTQWIRVLTTPTEAYRVNNFNIVICLYECQADPGTATRNGQGIVKKSSSRTSPHMKGMIGSTSWSTWGMCCMGHLTLPSIQSAHHCIISRRFSRYWA